MACLNIARRVGARALRLSACIFALAYLAACETSIPTGSPLTDELAIHCLLISDAEKQRLLLTKVLKNLSEPLPSVTDAIVEVNGVRFTAITMDRSNPTDPYNWTTTELNLQCGQLCSLRVFYRDRIIRGQTIVPQIAPVSVKGDTIFWAGEFAPYKYAVWLNDLHFTAIRKLPFVVRENYFTPFPPGRYRLRVEAYDENYAYAQESRINSIGIEGAFGLFAAACAWEDSVDLK